MHDVRNGGKKCRDCVKQDDVEEISSVHGSRWLSYWLKGNGEKSLEHLRGCRLFLPIGGAFGIAIRCVGAPAGNTWSTCESYIIVSTSLHPGHHHLAAGC